MRVRAPRRRSWAASVKAVTLADLYDDIDALRRIEKRLQDLILKEAP